MTLDFEAVQTPWVRSETALPSRRTCPPGTSRLSAASFAATSVIGRFSASRRRGSRLTCSSRTWPPFTFGGGDAVDLPSSGLIVFDHAARHVRGERREPTAYVAIGSAETSKRLIVGLICSGSRGSNRRDLFAHLRRGRLRIDFQAQLDADHRHALGGRRDDALDAVDAGDRVFDRPRHQRLDFFRTRAR